MKSLSLLLIVPFVLLSLAAFGQEPAAPALAAPAEASPAAASTEAPPANEPAAPEKIISTEAAKKQAEAIAEKVNQDARAQEASAGILKQIYLVAEKLESPLFHWGAFALMVAGVVSYALQLVLGKLFVLAKMSLSPSEILSDGLGLVVSLIGLVLTTQAAAQNSTFTQSPASVLSATAAGAVVGFLFFRWGTAQELAAADGRKAQAKAEPAKPKG